MIAKTMVCSAVAAALLAAGGWLSHSATTAALADGAANPTTAPTSRAAGFSSAVPTTAPATRDQVAAKVAETITNLLGKKDTERNQIKPSASWEDLDADDLEQAEIILDCEQTFGVTIPDDQAEKINTVGQLIDYILAHKPAEKGRP